MKLILQKEDKEKEGKNCVWVGNFALFFVVVVVERNELVRDCLE